MRAVDTNVLVRIITRDDPAQAEIADAFIEPGAWVPLVALLEATWVLGAAYEFGSSQIATFAEMLLGHKSFVLQDADAVTKALDLFRAKPSLGFADCLMLELARKAGHLPLGTFDRRLGRLEAAHQL